MHETITSLILFICALIVVVAGAALVGFAVTVQPQTPAPMPIPQCKGGKLVTVQASACGKVQRGWI